MEFITKVVDFVNNILWNYALLFLLVGTGVFYTFRLKFIQVRKFGKGMKRLFGGISLSGKKEGAGLSSFQALTTAIAAQVGTGNIAGAATAIMMGGPGAIFWMWVAAFFGMATIYAEATLAQKSRVTKDGHYIGGPVYYIQMIFKGKFGKFLAGFFSIAIILALGFMGNMVQSNSIASAFETAFNIPPIIIGIIIAAIAGLIFIGGIKRIASVTEKVVPLMAVFYLIGSTIIIAMNYKNIIPVFQNIFLGAFNPQAIGGGVLGITIQRAMRYGVARGLFSNEAGMGSTPHAHATANVEHPDDQGVQAFLGVFIDTFIVLTATALVILTTGVNFSTSLTGVPLAQAAYESAFGQAGAIFITVCLFFFAFTTIIGWYYFAEVNVRYLFGSKAVKFFTPIVLVLLVLGTTLKVDLVWNMSDMFNGLMVLPNLIALLAGSAIVVATSKRKEL